MFNTEFKTKLKTGDTVIVISGKHKGAKGEIVSIMNKKNRCIVKGVALVKKHKKATQSDEKSEIITKESSINLSNVLYFDEKSSKGVKLGYRIEDKKKLRINKKTGEVIK